MSSFKLKLILGACALVLSTHSWAAPVYNFAGSWIVGDGPDNASNPQVYSGREAAALLFGGSAMNYVVSTVDNDPANINFMSYLDGYGDDQYLFTPAADTFSLSSNGGGYANDPSYSAFVLDHTCFNRYLDLSESCTGYGTEFVNYAFRVGENDVPEPAILALFGAALLGLSIARRKKP